MKIVVFLLAAAFVMTGTTSFAFGECAGHSKAQLVKTQPQEQVGQAQIDKDQPAGTPLTVAEKVPEPVKPEAKASEKK